MRKRIRRFFLLMLTVAMLLTISVQALAQEQKGFVDMPHNWSTEALQKAVDHGLLSGYNNYLNPEQNLTRVEMATVINRAFGAKDKTNISNFTDVKSTDWFHDEMAKSVKMGTFQGDGNKLRPNDSITREEAFKVLSNALNVKAEKSNKQYSDMSEVSQWAKESVNGMINGGYIAGSNGKINPKANITRAEFAQLLHNLFGTYIKSAGIFNKVEDGNVIVSASNVILKDIIIKGDLIIADGVGEGEVTLDNVKVEGRMLVRAGGENSIIIKGDSEIETIIIVKQGNRIRILNETGKEIAVSTVEGDADVILEGKFKNVILQSPDITVYARNTEIENVEINGTRSKVLVDKDSKIEEIVVKAENVVIEGEGKVEEVEVKAGGTGTEITTLETHIYVNRGANNVVGTGGVEIEPNGTYINGKTKQQDAKPLKEDKTDSGSSGGSDGPTITRYSLNYMVVEGNGALISEFSDNSMVIKGTIVEFIATPNTGYEIKELKVNGEVIPLNGNVLSLEILTNTTLTVEFKLIEVELPMHTVIYSVIGEGGTIASNINSGIGVAPNTELTFIATPSIGYEVKEWKVNGLIVEAENTLTTTITEYTMVSVEFKAIPIDTITSPEVTMTANNTNKLRIDFDFDTTDVWVLGGIQVANLRQVDINYFLSLLFGESFPSTNGSNMEITSGPNYLEIELLDNAIGKEVFNADIHERDLNVIFIRDLTPNFSIFTNQEGIPSESVGEPIDLRFEMSLDYETGEIIDETPIKGLWIVKDTTPPILDSASIYPLPSFDNKVYVLPDDSLILEFTGLDQNLYKINPLWPARGYEYFALDDPYDGNDDFKEYNKLIGLSIDYSNGTWTLYRGMGKYGGELGLTIDLEDYAGNKWSDVVSEQERHFEFFIMVLSNDIESLQELLVYRRSLNSIDYTWQSWEYLATLTDEIENNMAKYSEEEIGLKILELRKVIENLEFSIPYRDELDHLLAYINYLRPEDYSKESWDKMIFIRDNMPEKTQTDVNLKCEELGWSLDDLDNNYIGIGLDKRELYCSLSLVDSLNAEDFDAIYWAILAEIVDTYPEDTQEEVNYKFAALDSALNNLYNNVPVKSVEIASGWTDISAGTDYYLIAEVSPSIATNQNIIWSIVDGENIGKIESGYDNEGVLTAYNLGQITVRATSEENPLIYDEMTFTVIDVDVRGVEMISDLTEVSVGEKYQLSAKVLPENAANQNIIWRLIKGTKIASINDTGELTVLGLGQIIVRAESEETNLIYAEITLTAISID